jgi:hypothetical protein
VRIGPRRGQEHAAERVRLRDQDLDGRGIEDAGKARVRSADRFQIDVRVDGVESPLRVGRASDHHDPFHQRLRAPHVARELELQEIRAGTRNRYEQTIRQIPGAA